MRRHGRACPGHLDLWGTAVPCLTRMAGTSPGMTGEDVLAASVVVAALSRSALPACVGAGLSHPPGQDRRAVSGRRRHRRADAVRRRGLEQRLGQPFIIENRGGAGTTLGATAVARSEPDGYTIMVGTASTFAVAPGPLQAAGLRSDQGLLADHAVRDRAVRAGGQPVARRQLGQGAGRARQEQARRTRLCVRRRRRRASHLLRTVHDA